MTAIDRDVRTRLVTDLDTTFFVEAGAGTGKTRELVARIVALIARGKLTITGLVAITFTEAAAAELRDRVRQGLALAAGDLKAWPEAESRERCLQATLEIDLAAVQTIHAFAASLLRTFPLEAGLPPAFSISDDIQQDQAFEERFRQWLYDEVPLEDGSGRRQAVARCLNLGMTPDRLRELARALQEQYDVLSRGQRWPAAVPSDALRAAHDWGSRLMDLDALNTRALDPDSDALVREIRRIQFTARRLRDATDEDSALSAIQSYLALPPRQLGKLSDWTASDDGGCHPMKRCKQTFKEASAELSSVLSSHRTAAISDLLLHLSAFVLDYASERNSQGTATFHDLLVWARDVLRDHPDVRRAAADRYQRLFVDEFQDTDPLQAELIAFLAADPCQANESDWRRIRFVRGKLFLVGDPKQSIYRFRRADIAMYEALYARTDEASDKVALSQTRRSVAPLVDWVNHHFACEMQAESGVQPTYVPLEPRPALDGIDINESACGLRTFGGPLDASAAERWSQEADAVAKLAHQVVREGWCISARCGDAWSDSPARYSDICVLLPSRTNLRRLERAFERLNVPYRIESGSLVLQTQEVRDLLTCLRAIDDPSDQVALVAALRSPAYGCSDVDLLQWVEAGGPLSYERRRDDLDGPVARAFENLREFHAQRMQRSPAETIEAFVRDRGLAVQAFGQPRPREAWRRLRYVVAQAHRLAGSGLSSGEPTLRALLDWLERLQQTTYYDAESAVPESDEDAIRLLTVHGSKGLEFPVVILTGLGSTVDRTTGVKITANHLTRSVEARCGDFTTSGFDQEQERRLDQAERLRLLYVATTRAREHLILGLHHKPSRDNPTHAQRIFHLLQSGPEGLTRDFRIEEMPPTASMALETPTLSADEHRAEEDAWLTHRQERVTALASEHVVTPSGLAETSSDSEETVRVRRSWSSGGAPLGEAVHTVLQWLNLETMSNLDALVWPAASEYGVEAEQVRSYVQRVVASAPIRAAVASGRYWREVPISVAVGEALVEGAVDLMYEHPDGTLGIVDYKTDRVGPGTVTNRAGHYHPQAAAYALAVEHATDRTVSSIEFIFAAINDGVVRLGPAEVRSAIAEVKLRVGESSEPTSITGETPSEAYT